MLNRTRAITRLPVIAIALVCLISFSRPCVAEQLDRVVAKINEDILMASDIAEAVAGHSGALKNPSSLMALYNQATPDVVEALFDRTLLLQSAKEQKISVPDNELDHQVEQLVAEIKKNFPSEKAFRKELEGENLSLQEFKASLRKKAEIDFKLYAAVSRRYSISESEARQYEEDRKAQGKQPLRLHLKRLGVPIQGSGEQAREKAKSRVTALLSKIHSENLKFEDGVRKYTEIPGEKATGGDLGSLTAEKMSSTLLDATQHLEEGEVSKPVIAGDYACIFYMESKRGAKAALQEQRFLAERKKLIAELRRKAQIRIYDEKLRKMLPTEYGGNKGNADN